MSRDGRIRAEFGSDTGVEGLDVYGVGYLEDWSKKGCGSEGDGELFISEHKPEIVWIDCCIITSSLFRIDVPSSSS
jgi:hypothetical protein